MNNLKQLRISEEEFACKKPPNRYRVLRCTQNLYKSTYKGNAFKKGHTYFIHPDPTAAKEGLVYVVDETGHPGTRAPAWPRSGVTLSHLKLPRPGS